MDKYAHEGVVGEGSYGVVMKCRNRETGQVVAIKKFLETDEDQTVRKIAMREIRMLKKLRHDNLINLIEVFRRRRKLYLVFEFMDHTVLEELEEHPRGIGPDTSRSYIFQVLRGIEFCHLNNIVHRDVKPENVLVSKLGVIKLCDFGFARLMAAPGEVYTDYVATRWYRAPELLVGDAQYGREVDVWAIGCLYAEMLTGDPLFPGESDIDQLFQITQLLGPLAAKHRLMVGKNPMFSGLSVPPSNNQAQKNLADQFPQWSPNTLSFIKACLSMEPLNRPACSTLIKFDLFTSDNFDRDFPGELQAKLQQEFGHSNLLLHQGVQHFMKARKKDGPSGLKKASLCAKPPISDEERRKKKDSNFRRKSDAFDVTMGGSDLQSKSSILARIYSPSRPPDSVDEALVRGSKGSRIVAPPATLTADMGRSLSSAHSEHCLRYSEAQRTDNLEGGDLASMGPEGLLSPSPAASRLKRYDGFEQGLNMIHSIKGSTPFLTWTQDSLRNRSPPSKKTKSKENQGSSSNPARTAAAHRDQKKQDGGRDLDPSSQRTPPEDTLLNPTLDKQPEVTTTTPPPGTSTSPAGNTPHPAVTSTTAPFSSTASYQTVLSDANSMLAKSSRNSTKTSCCGTRALPRAEVYPALQPQPMPTVGGAPSQMEPLSLPSVAGATAAKPGLNYPRGQPEVLSSKAQGAKSPLKHQRTQQWKHAGPGGHHFVNHHHHHHHHPLHNQQQVHGHVHVHHPKELGETSSRPPSHNLPLV